MPFAGATVEPAVTAWPVPLSITLGTQPRFPPLIACDAPSLKSATCPDTDQPGLPARVSVTVTGLILPVVVSSVPAGFNVGEGNVTLVLATLITSEPAVIVVVIVSVAVDDPGGGGAADTVSDTADDDEVAKAVGSAGMKLATSECVPAASVVVVVLAVPPETATAEPRFVPLSVNCTVPAAVVGVTPAFRVIEAPEATVPLGVTESVVVVGGAEGGALTVKFTVFDVDPPKAVVSVGVNTAVRLCGDPAALNVVVVVEALPLVTTTAAPIVLVPSRNCTVPAADGLTAAVNVTELPWVTGLAGAAVNVVVVGA
jgi:hypothetical protein